MLACENDSWKQVHALGSKVGLGGYFFFFSPLFDMQTSVLPTLTPLHVRIIRQLFNTSSTDEEMLVKVETLLCYSKITVKMLCIYYYSIIFPPSYFKVNIKCNNLCYLSQLLQHSLKIKVEQNWRSEKKFVLSRLQNHAVEMREMSRNNSNQYH